MYYLVTCDDMGCVYIYEVFNDNVPAVAIQYFHLDSTPVLNIHIENDGVCA